MYRIHHPSKIEDMARQYPQSFRPAWAVTGSVQNSKQPETEALAINPVEDTGYSSDEDSAKAREENRNENYHSVASGPSSQELKAGGRDYSKKLPSSWTLANEAKPPLPANIIGYQPSKINNYRPTKIVGYRPTNIDDYRPTNIIDSWSSARPVNRSDVPGGPQKFLVRHGPLSYNSHQTSPPPSIDQPLSRFSAESGEGDAPPRPPEGYKVEKYHDRIAFPGSGNAYGNVRNPPMTTTAPWRPPYESWDTDSSRQMTSHLWYRHSSTTTSSGSGDVPARAPSVSSTYSPIIRFS